MNANDVIAHYAMERLQLMMELQKAQARAKELEEKVKHDD